jgi:GNAT superfamily N-acetyltransferase
VRAIRPDDKVRLLDHFRSLSDQSVYFRFLGLKRELTERELASLTEVDFTSHVGLVATIREDDAERIVGVARCIANEDNPHRAEVAFAVSDRHQGRGIGTLRLAHLVALAREAGITEFEADVLAANRRLLEAFAATGLVTRRSVSGGVVHVSFPTG